METNKSSPESQMEEPKEIYLEIGPGLDPSVETSDRSFSDGRVYIGVETAHGNYYSEDGQEYGPAVRSQLSEIQDEIRSERPGENISFMFADGQHLPFQNHSIKEIYMANVITAPLHPKIKAQLLEEARRSLAQDGELVVRTTWDLWMNPPHRVEGMLQAAGLDVSRVVSAEVQPEEFAELERIYGRTRVVTGPVGYYCFARKSER